MLLGDKKFIQTKEFINAFSFPVFFLKIKRLSQRKIQRLTRAGPAKVWTFSILNSTDVGLNPGSDIRW